MRSIAAILVSLCMAGFSPAADIPRIYMAVNN